MTLRAQSFSGPVPNSQEGTVYGWVIIKKSNVTATIQNVPCQSQGLVFLWSPQWERRVLYDQCHCARPQVGPKVISLPPSFESIDRTSPLKYLSLWGHCEKANDCTNFPSSFWKWHTAKTSMCLLCTRDSPASSHGILMKTFR